MFWQPVFSRDLAVKRTGIVILMAMDTPSL